MSTVERFEDLLVWQKARELAVAVYRDYAHSKDFGFKDQILRAGVSIMNNIAEGFDRKGNKEFGHYLYIAKGSCAEVRSMLYLGSDLRHCSPERTRELLQMTNDISCMLGGLIRSLANTTTK